MAVHSPITAPEPPWSADLSAFFKQRQNETLLMELGGLATLGVLLLSGVQGFIAVSWGFYVGLGLIALCIVAGLLLRWTFLGACLAMVLGSLAAIVAVVTWGALLPRSCSLQFRSASLRSASAPALAWSSPASVPSSSCLPLGHTWTGPSGPRRLLASGTRLGSSGSPCDLC